MDSLVFFGESYGNLTRTKLDYLNADLIIAVGTSLTIPSIQRLIKRLKCLTYIINLQKTALPE
jgi:NAD-dependent SIR2 family protein deacetylase